MNATADLHVHSRFSDHPSEWFLQRLGANESYTEPEAVYAAAKAQGMSFVTLTDHNTLAGVLQLKQAHPQDVFTGVESTAYFPEDGCKVHILIYGVTVEEFEQVQKHRVNIYDLRDYLRERGLAYAVAHATYALNEKLNVEHLEKLILLFDVFEGINGSRHKLTNEPWYHILAHLTPEHIATLQRKHGIVPFSSTPWNKGFSAGSDDHAGLFIGKTYTAAEADTAEAFVTAIREKRTTLGGRQNDYQSLAFALYKIGYEFSRSRSAAGSSSLLGQLSELMFAKGSLSFTQRMKMHRLRLFGNHGEGGMNYLLLDLVDTLRESRDVAVEEKVRLVYQKIAAMADEFFKMVLRSMETDLRNGDVLNIVGNLASAIPGAFLAMPFFSTVKHMYEHRALATQLCDQLGIGRHAESKRVLWFTDTLTDLNGVAVTLKNIGWVSHNQRHHVTIAAALAEEERTSDLPPNVLALPYIYEAAVPAYEQIRLRIPSVLRALEVIQNHDPDHIVISTPGPVGLLGLLVSKLMNVPVTGIYHTDFTRQASQITADESIAGLLEAYTKWFYGHMHEVHVPTHQYMDILEQRGFDRSRMKLFRRGIDARTFAPHPGARRAFMEQHGLADGRILLYAGRVSKDKNLAFLADVYKELLAWRAEIALVIVGDGPYCPELRQRLADCPRAIFTGKLSNAALPRLYSAADLFVFPSVTDTFGMAVLEAQACKLPAIVSDIGGAKEIIADGISGCIVPVDATAHWSNAIKDFLLLLEHAPEKVARMRQEARSRAIRNSDWSYVIGDIVGSARTVRRAPAVARRSAPVPQPVATP